ncbi:MAG: TonB-dependent receptor [Alphaproteobacteria bacterium]
MITLADRSTPTQLRHAVLPARTGGTALALTLSLVLASPVLASLVLVSPAYAQQATHETDATVDKAADTAVENQVADDLEQVAYQGPVLDNIVVVAQKREKSLQKVPLSISAIDSEFMDDWSITDIDTATLYTPNVRIANAGYFIMPRIRGFGTNQNNKAFEPPAGVAIDGIPYTRLEYFNSAMFDVARMEVLRGPQGTTFGKNTTAGLIHIITKDPTDEYEGFIDVQGGEYDRQRVEAAIGGPIIQDVVHFRIAGLYDSRDGYIENSALDRQNAPRTYRTTDKMGVRAKLHFPDLFGTDLKLTYEYAKSEAEGAGLEMFDVTPAMQELMLRYDANTDFTRGNLIGTTNAADFRNMDVTSLALDWQMDIDDWSVIVVGGHAVLEGSAALDIDGSPIESISGTDADRSPTDTLEIRTLSPELPGFLGINNLFGLDLGTSTLLGGLNYQRREIDGQGITYNFGISLLEILAVGTISNQNSQFPGTLADALTLLQPLIPGLEAIPVVGDYAESADQDFDQISNAYGVFGQVDWQMTEKWGAQFAFRLGHETKDGSFNQTYTSTTAVMMQALGVEEYATSREISETTFAPRVALTYQLSDDIGIYAHWARGFRGGGFNAFAFRNNDEELMYKKETADDYGIDIKTEFADGRARLNVSFFRLDVTEFQVLTGRQTDLGVGLGQSIVENAPKARAQGIEADFTYLPFAWLMLFSTLGYNDSEYLDFTFNGCLGDNSNTDGDDDPRCDATGKPFPITPKLTGTMLGMVTIPLNANGLALRVGGGFDYQSEQYATFSLDERYKLDPTFRWRATLGLEQLGGSWSLKIQGENLTDENLSIRQGSVNRGYMVGSVEPPRTIYASFRYSL